MKIRDFVEKCGLNVLVGESWLEREIDGCYIGDLLSWAMGKVQADNVWLTVMGNVNAIAVAVLADAACIVLVDGASLDDAAKEKAEQQEVVVLSAAENAYTLALKFAEMEA